MADPKFFRPDNPGTPKKSDATAPLGDQSAQLLSSIAALANATVQIHLQMVTLVDDFKKAFESTQKMNGGLKDVLNTSQKIEDVQRKIAEINKRIGSGMGAQKVTWKEVVDDVGDLLALTQRLAKESPSAAAALNRQIRVLEDTFKTAKKEADHFGGSVAVVADKMKDFKSTVSGVIKEVGRLNTRFDTRSIAGFESHVRNLNSSLRSMGSSSRIMERMESLFDSKRAFQRVKSDRATVRDVQAAGFHASRIRAAQKAGVDAPEMGSELTSAELGRIMASRKGRGLNARLGNMLQRRMASEEVAGGGAGGSGYRRFAKFGTKALVAGGEEGGMIGGAAELAMGIPGVGEAIMAGVVAAKAITGVWDKMAEQNKQIEKGMGAALFTPGKTGYNALNTVRQNLGANLTGAFGQNLTGNLAIAQAMQENGLDITEISSGKPGALKNKRLAGGGRPDTANGFVGGVFGEFQRNALVAGRAAGLDSSESVVRMTKMIHEMGQSFNATFDFLANINTQARLAGISTSAYLKVVDDFDKMNKSFNEAVSIIQVLGATGASTGDDLKTMADAITGAGEQKTTPQVAFALQDMAPGISKAWIEGEQNSNLKRIKDARDALVQEGGVSQDEANKLLPDNADSGMILDARRRLDRMKGDNVDPSKIQNISNLIDRAFTQSQHLNQAKTAGENPVGVAIGMESTGQDMLSKTTVQQSNLQKVMDASGISFNDLRKNPNLINTKLEAVMAAKSLSIKPEDLMTLIKAIGETSAGMVNEGAAKLPEGMKQEEYSKFFKIGQKTFEAHGIKEGETDKIQKYMDENVDFKEDIIKGLQDDPNQGGAFLTALSDTLGPSDLDKSQLHDVAEQTRTSADYFANAFEYLFNKLLDPLKTIESILKSLPFVDSIIPASMKDIAGDDLGKYQALKQGGDLDKSMSDLQGAIDNLDPQDPKSAATKRKLEANWNDLNVIRKMSADDVPTAGEWKNEQDAAKVAAAAAGGATGDALSTLVDNQKSDSLQGTVMAGVPSQMSWWQKMMAATKIAGAGALAGAPAAAAITITVVDASTKLYSSLVGSHVSASLAKAGETASPPAATPDTSSPKKQMLAPLGSYF
jgi:hypothetical protein